MENKKVMLIGATGSIGKRLYNSLKEKRELKEAYVIENLRTPFGRRNGYFRNTHPGT